MSMGCCSLRGLSCWSSRRGSWRAGRTDLHRRLGVGGGVLAAAMVVAGLAAAITAARRGTPPDAIAGLPPPLVFLVIPLTDMVVFAVLVGAGPPLPTPERHPQAAAAARHDQHAGGAHRQVPGGQRTSDPAAFFGGMLLFVVALAVYDWRTRGRVHRATMLGGLLSWFQCHCA